jgi:hypothetical protein
MLMRLLVMGSVCVSFIVLTTACTSEGHAPGGGSLNIPQITSAVNGSASGVVIQPKATSGQSINTQTCSGCGGASTDFSYAHSLASLFVIQGKIADANSCAIGAIRQFDLLPGLGDGTDVYTVQDTMAIKANVKVTGDTVTSFTVIHCMDGEQVQYMSGTNVGGSVTFKFRSKSDSNFMTMDAEGTMSGDTWTSKTLDVLFYNQSGSSSSFTITQTASLLDITGVLDNGTLGTLDGSDYRSVSRVELLGDSPATYAIGDGSVRSAVGAGGAANNNWNGDTGVHGGGPTTYDSHVASATLPSIPSSYPTDFTSDEQWNCQAVGTPVNLMTAAAGNPAVIAAMNECNEAFQ